MNNGNPIKIENYSLKKLMKEEEQEQEQHEANEVNNASDFDIHQDHDYIMGHMYTQPDPSPSNKSDRGFGDFIVTCFMFGLVGTPLLLLGTSISLYLIVVIILSAIFYKKMRV